MKPARAIKVLRSVIRGHKVHRVRAVAALADLLSTGDDRADGLPPAGAAVVLIAFAQYLDAHSVAPSVRDLEASVGRSRSTIHEHLGTLERRGLLARTQKKGSPWRNLKLTRAGKRYIERVQEISDVRV